MTVHQTVGDGMDKVVITIHKETTASAVASDIIKSGSGCGARITQEQRNSHANYNTDKYSDHP